MTRLPALLAAVAAALLLLPALALPPAASAPVLLEYPRCEHPWPCGDGREWPPGLEGPFALREVQHRPLPSWDRTTLDGWLLFPDLPEGVKAPAVLLSTHEVGLSHPPPDEPGFLGAEGLAGHGPVARLLEEGYIIAVYSIRGTGNSGGCQDRFGPPEQQDQPLLVAWLASQPWSNGRVGMVGTSWAGTTPFQAAVAGAPALKALAASAPILDAYQAFTSPQGASVSHVNGGLFAVAEAGALSHLPATNAATSYWTTDHLGVAAERVCPASARAAQGHASRMLLDDRDEAYWKDHRLTDRAGDATAALLMRAGFQDFLLVQDLAAFPTFARAPKAAYVGQCPHSYFACAPAWNDAVLAWFDFWLKGLGAPPADLGVVRYEDQHDAWHDAAGWPPPSAAQQVLYLVDGDLAPEPGEGARGFRSLPLPGGERWTLDEVVFSEDALYPYAPEDGLCLAALAPGASLQYTSRPAAARALLAGNPSAHLRLASDLPGGIVSVNLFDLAPDFACDGARATGAAFVGAGAADLRFLHGNFVAQPFPVGTPVDVRVDIAPLAHVLPEGHRLALLVGRGDPSGRDGAPYYPEVTLHAGGIAGSHVVLPFVEGALGGEAPALADLPRPLAS